MEGVIQKHRVIPAKAGIQLAVPLEAAVPSYVLEHKGKGRLDPGLRRDDASLEVGVWLSL